MPFFSRSTQSHTSKLYTSPPLFLFSSRPNLDTNPPPFLFSSLFCSRPSLLTKATQTNEFDKVDVLVATPLRLKSLIDKKLLNLSAVQYLVLDEADK